MRVYGQYNVLQCNTGGLLKIFSGALVGSNVKNNAERKYTPSNQQIQPKSNIKDNLIGK